MLVTKRWFKCSVRKISMGQQGCGHIFTELNARKPSKNCPNCDRARTTLSFGEHERQQFFMWDDPPKNFDRSGAQPLSVPAFKSDRLVMYND